MIKNPVKGYERLAEVLVDAYDQSARGKGIERHGNDLPFDKQPMQDYIRAHGIGFATGQAAKKLQESHGLKRKAAIHELLGVIVYTAGAIIALENQPDEEDVPTPGRIAVPEQFPSGLLKIVKMADNTTESSWALVNNRNIITAQFASLEEAIAAGLLESSQPLIPPFSYDMVSDGENYWGKSRNKNAVETLQFRSSRNAIASAIAKDFLDR